jgi:hypothetical protein
VADELGADQATYLGAFGEINRPVGGAYRRPVPQFTSWKLGDCAQAHLPRLSPVCEERIFSDRWHALAAVLAVSLCDGKVVALVASAVGRRFSLKGALKGTAAGGGGTILVQGVSATVECKMTRQQEWQDPVQSTMKRRQWRQQVILRMLSAPLCMGMVTTLG